MGKGVNQVSPLTSQVTLEGEDFLHTSFQTLARVLTEAGSERGEAALFRAAWRWGTAEIVHMQYLPEIIAVGG